MSALLRRGAAGRTVALGVTLFAIAGFGYGLSVTARGGGLPDVVYHVTVLPVLLVTLALLLRPSASLHPGDFSVNSTEKSPPTEKSPQK